MSLQDRYKKIMETIAAAAGKARRDPKSVTLIGVTKAATPDQIKQLVEMRHYDLGESRVQQLQQRAAQMDEWLTRQHTRKEDTSLPPPGGLRWHMIGHLQRNKVRPVVGICRMIHSIDSLRLAEEIQDEAEHQAKAALSSPPTPHAAANTSPSHAPALTPQSGRPSGKNIEVLLEVNVAEEGTKFGVAAGAALHLAEQIDTMDDVSLVGLMCMAPFSSNPEDSRPVFVRLRELFEEIRFRKIAGEKFQHLSMGMSGDYPIAIEEGATLIRLGTALFG